MEIFYKRLEVNESDELTAPLPYEEKVKEKLALTLSEKTHRKKFSEKQDVLLLKYRNQSETARHQLNTAGRNGELIFAGIKISNRYSRATGPLEFIPHQYFTTERTFIAQRNEIEPWCDIQTMDEYTRMRHMGEHHAKWTNVLMDEELFAKWLSLGSIDVEKSSQPLPTTEEMNFEFEKYKKTIAGKTTTREDTRKWAASVFGASMLVRQADDYDLMLAALQNRKRGPREKPVAKLQLRETHKKS